MLERLITLLVVFCISFFSSFFSSFLSLSSAFVSTLSTNSIAKALISFALTAYHSEAAKASALWLPSSSGEFAVQLTASGVFSFIISASFLPFSDLSFESLIRILFFTKASHVFLAFITWATLTSHCLRAAFVRSVCFTYQNAPSALRANASTTIPTIRMISFFFLPLSALSEVC